MNENSIIFHSLSGGTWANARYCSKRKKHAQAYWYSLQQERSFLQNHVDNDDTSSFNSLQSLKLRFVNFDNEKAKASKIRARTKWIEEGETTSAFFLHLEKKNCASKIIDAIFDDNDTFVADSEELLFAWHSFYISLFSSQPTDDAFQDNFLDSLERFLSSQEPMKAY